MLVAYVAAIEAVGKMLPVAPKAKCGTCGFTPGTAAAQFRAALQLVMSETEARSLASDVYPSRSGTARAGILLGAETLPGSIQRPGLLTVNPPVDFGLRRLIPLQSVARKVVLHGLVGDAPPPAR